MALPNYSNIFEQVATSVSSVGAISVESSIMSDPNFVKKSKLVKNNIEQAKDTIKSIMDLSKLFDKNTIQNIKNFNKNKSVALEYINGFAGLLDDVFNGNSFKSLTNSKLKTFNAVDWVAFKLSMHSMISAMDVSNILRLTKIRLKMSGIVSLLNTVTDVLERMHAFGLKMIVFRGSINRGMKVMNMVFESFLDINETLNKYKLGTLIQMQIKTRIFDRIVTRFTKLITRVTDGMGVGKLISVSIYSKIVKKITGVFEYIAEKIPIITLGSKALRLMTKSIRKFASSLILISTTMLPQIVLLPITFGLLNTAVNLMTKILAKSARRTNIITRGSVGLTMMSGSIFKFALSMTALSVLSPLLILSPAALLLLKLDVFVMSGMFNLLSRVTVSALKGAATLAIMGGALALFSTSLVAPLIVFTQKGIGKSLLMLTASIAGAGVVFGVLGLAAPVIALGAGAVTLMGVAIMAMAGSLYVACKAFSAMDIDGAIDSMAKVKTLIASISDPKFILQLIGATATGLLLTATSVELALSGMALKRAGKIWSKIDTSEDGAFAKSIKGIRNIFDPIIELASEYKLKILLIRPFLKTVKKLGSSLGDLADGLKQMSKLKIDSSLTGHLGDIIRASIDPFLITINKNTTFNGKRTTYFDLFHARKNKKAIMRFLRTVSKMGRTIGSLAKGLKKLERVNIDKLLINDNINNIITSTVAPFLESVNNTAKFDGENITYFDLLHKQKHYKALRRYLDVVQEVGDTIFNLGKHIDKLGKMDFDNEKVSSKVQTIINSCIDPMVQLVSSVEVKKKNATNVINVVEMMTSTLGTLADKIGAFAKNKFAMPDGSVVSLMEDDFVKAANNIKTLVKSIIISDSEAKSMESSKEFEKKMSSASRFIEKINKADIQKLEQANGLFSALRDISKDINGNFQGLANTINDKLVTALENLKEVLEQTNEQLTSEPMQMSQSPVFANIETPSTPISVASTPTPTNQQIDMSKLHQSIMSIDGILKEIRDAGTSTGLRVTLRNDDPILVQQLN